MRKFNDFEQDILKRISKIFKEQNLENVDLAKIIRTELDAFAVEWDNEKGETTIFCVEQNMAKDYFLKLISIISLLKYLEDAGCVFLTKMSDLGNNDHCLYDREKYVRVPIPEKTEDPIIITSAEEAIDKNVLAANKLFPDQKFTYQRKPENIVIGSKIFNGVSKTNLSGGIRDYSDFAKHLEYYTNRMVYPTQTLINLVDNNSKTEEQIRFEEELIEAKKQTKFSKWAFRVSFFGLIIAILIPFLISKCSTTKIDQQSIDSIGSAINKNQVIVTEIIEKQNINDTTDMKIIKTITNSKTVK